MRSSAPATLPPSTQQERLEAALCHVLGIPFPYAAPLMFYFLRRGRSKFVTLHAAASLIETFAVGVVLFIGLAISLCFTIANVWNLVQSRGGTFEWSMVWQGLLKAAITWVVLSIVSAYYTLMSILDAIRALNGGFRGGTLLRRLALKAVGVQQDVPAIGKQ